MSITRRHPRSRSVGPSSMAASSLARRHSLEAAFVDYLTPPARSAISPPLAAALVAYYSQQVFNHVRYAFALVAHDGAHFRPCSSPPAYFPSSCSALVGYWLLFVYCRTQHTKTRYFFVEAVTALLRESHTPNKTVTVLFTSTAVSPSKAVMMLWQTTALLRDPYCNLLSPFFVQFVMGMKQNIGRNDGVVVAIFSCRKSQTGESRRTYSRRTFTNRTTLDPAL